MKQWMQKLLEQFDWDWNQTDNPNQILSDDRATLVFFLDTYNKNLIELDNQPVRRIRETLDTFTKQIVCANSKEDLERVLFRLRQFFASYRIEESSFVQKTFDDFKNIIWDFADQLHEELRQEQKSDDQMQKSIADLREAVESNSIVALKAKSREFIDFYVEQQTRKDERRTISLQHMQKNLRQVKKKLLEVNEASRMDHLTGVHNRKSFDEQAKKYTAYHAISETPVSLMMIDIDHFKKVNDTYGHDVGDFVLKECARVMKEIFDRDSNFVARIGGEEFAVILPDYRNEHALRKAEDAMKRIRQEAFVTGEHKIAFTVSIGIAELGAGESVSAWMKRADTALYQSKQNGRNRATSAEPYTPATKVA